jgi:hypothetical protein
MTEVEKKEVDVRDLKPSKDAKGGRRHGHRHTTSQVNKHPNDDGPRGRTTRSLPLPWSVLAKVHDEESLKVL